MNCSLRFVSLCAMVFILGSCGGDSSGTPTITLEPELLTGTSSIAGTVTLPDSASSGKYIQLQIDNDGGGSEIKGQVRTTSAKSIAYSITGLRAGTYSIRMRVDQTGNLTFGDVGDFEGYCCGTAEAPAPEAADATLIAVAADEAKTAVDFTITAID